MLKVKKKQEPILTRKQDKGGTMKLFRTLKKSLWEVLEEQEPFGIVNNQNIDYYLEKATMKAEKEIKEQSNTETKQLKTENESLKKQLKNAVELPCKVGDTVWICTRIDFDVPEEIVEGKVTIISVDSMENINTFRIYVDHKYVHDKRGFLLNRYIFFENEIFLTKSEAEARLAELEGKSNEKEKF